MNKCRPYCESQLVCSICSLFMCIGYIGAKICSMGREHNSKSDVGFEELNHRCPRSVEDS